MHIYWLSIIYFLSFKYYINKAKYTIKIFFDIFYVRPFCTIPCSFLEKAKLSQAAATVYL